MIADLNIDTGPMWRLGFMWNSKKSDFDEMELRRQSSESGCDFVGTIKAKGKEKPMEVFVAYDGEGFRIILDHILADFPEDLALKFGFDH